MAGNISDYLQAALLDAVFLNTPYTSPATVYCGIVSSLASDADMKAGTLTNEITGYTGSRVAVAFGAPSPIAGAETIANTGNLDFTVMPAVTVKYAIVCDSPTIGAGNILYWCPLTSPKTTNAGDTFRIPVGDLVLNLD
jgi:hypothetical protein